MASSVPVHVTLSLVVWMAHSSTTSVTEFMRAGWIWPSSHRPTNPEGRSPQGCCQNEWGTAVVLMFSTVLLSAGYSRLVVRGRDFSYRERRNSDNEMRYAAFILDIRWVQPKLTSGWARCSVETDMWLRPNKEFLMMNFYEDCRHNTASSAKLLFVHAYTRNAVIHSWIFQNCVFAMSANRSNVIAFSLSHGISRYSSGQKGYALQ